MLRRYLLSTDRGVIGLLNGVAIPCVLLVARRRIVAGATLAALILTAVPAFTQGPAELPPGLMAPAPALPGPSFDVEAATAAYLAQLSDAQRAQSDAYFEGGYWLQLWGLLYALGVAYVLLATRWSVRLRDLARRVSARPFVCAWAYTALWLVATTALEFPWSVYTGFIREHQYGLATQSFGPWLGDRAMGLGVAMLLASPLVAGIYQGIRRAGAGGGSGRPA